ncbi:MULTISPECIES: sodium:proton antiporter [unclassified Beijerinckia]|uniref:sodium:proton antiporter n=1 Tax=unclassified Beijerinckia TaxID=2638183 RepID=UPI00089ACB75|nr:MULTISPECIES: sodium:proton antiporter [unclassified Beijerinckia]MDH7794293.1 Na+/H+ antiporter NhaD/arsenite permease-like protein [Beijerinckia sp. GAS462]SEB58005.1 transporter, UIT6 family [Beijerinckia sp. 28-YEA-48]
MSGIQQAVCRLLVLVCGLCCTPAFAAEPQLDGRAVGVVWVLPFVGMLLSIALMPLALPTFWHHHYGKVSAFWALAFLLPAAVLFGPGLTGHELLHTLALEYIPFLILIGTLYCVTGHIHIRGNLHGSPLLNTGLLALGTGLASVMGTTGASMLLIRPLIRANDDRRYNVHVVIFFIFLVANIGGSLTPLGDPPLFLGFLQGVHFSWTLVHLLAPMAFTCAILLALFFVIDFYLYRKEGRTRPDPTPDSALSIEGTRNLLLIPAVLAVVLASGSLKLGELHFLSVTLEVQNVLRDVLLLLIAYVSFATTPHGTRVANGFDFEPVVEVAKLFAAIFITIVPVIAMLKAGREGALATVIGLVTTPDGLPINGMYFWLTGALSSFLDNAPTYLVFFNAAGGDAQQLMGPLASTLTAISAGAVFMGANSYIGNAPNFLVKSIAESRGIPMPSFFGYMLWSGCLLLPIFVLLTLIFFS